MASHTSSMDASNNLSNTALITDAELADFLSDCTDSHPNTPEHEVTYHEDEQDVASFDTLDIPFALPVNTKIGANGGAVDYSIEYAAESDIKQKAAKKPSAKSAKKSAKKAGAATSKSAPACADTQAKSATSSSPTTTGTKRSAPSTEDPPAQKPKRGSGEPIKYKYPDLNEPGIDEEELKRRKRETRLMKNRESANRSRLRRKKNLEDLEVKNGELRAELDLAREQVRALADSLQLLVPRMHAAGVTPTGVLPSELQRQLQLLQLARLFTPTNGGAAPTPASKAAAASTAPASAPALAAKLSALHGASGAQTSPSLSPPPSPSASLSSATASVAGDSVTPGTDGSDGVLQSFHADVEMIGTDGASDMAMGGDDGLFFEHDDTVFRSMPLSSSEMAGVARAHARKQVALATAQKLKQQRMRRSGLCTQAPVARTAAPSYPTRVGRFSQMLFMFVAVMAALVAVVAAVGPRSCGDGAGGLMATGVLSQFASLAVGGGSQ